MNLNDYQQQASTTLVSNHAYGDIDPRLMAIVLGLAEESGEVLGKFKKLIRDKNGIITDDDRTEILKELGDVLWYVATTAQLLGSSLDDVARTNLDKLASRQQRGLIGGSGDNR